MKSISVLSCLFFIAIQIAGQTLTPGELYDQSIAITNPINQARRSFTIELIHHGTDNRELLEKAEKVHLLTLHAVKAFDNLLKNNAAEAEMLNALREWARKNNKDLDYDNLRKVLQGRDSRTPRELLADLKTLDAAESEGMPERELGEIYARFVNRHRISLVPADSASIQQMRIMNSAIKWQRKVWILVFEGDICMQEYIAAFNSEDPEGMIAAHNALKATLPDLLNRLEKLGAFGKDGDLLVRARYLLGFLNAFEKNGMVPQIGIFKKIKSSQATTANYEKMDAQTKAINERYNPALEAFTQAKKEFLKRYVPKE